MGLACSNDISNMIGGSLIINFSKNYLTSFTFKMPVKKADHLEQPGKEEKLKYVQKD